MQKGACRRDQKAKPPMLFAVCGRETSGILAKRVCEAPRADHLWSLTSSVTQRLVVAVTASCSRVVCDSDTSFAAMEVG